MGEVPCNDNLHTIDRCNSYMKSIFRIFAWYPLVSNNLFGKMLNFFFNIEHRKFCNSGKPFLCLIWITSARLFKDKRRNVGSIF